MTLRALLRDQRERNAKEEIVLLTTFDAGSRVVAHQEVHIRDVQRQAKHLNVSLLGVPLIRASGQSYPDRLRQALANRVLARKTITALAFGDLHLMEIRNWREKELALLGIPLKYPLFNVDYQVLLADLETSGVPCVVSASTVDSVVAGTMFTREFAYGKDGVASRMDAFGEQGEFHTLAQVWEVGAQQALGQ